MSRIIGKDRNVEDTISIAKKLLSDNGFKLIEDSILNPVKGIWSVHLKDSESQFYTNGKGATKSCALASAYCEFIERLGMAFFFDDYAIDGFNRNESWFFSPDEVSISNTNEYKKHLLTSELWEFYDPENILGFKTFVDSGTCNEDAIISYPFIEGCTGKDILFPIELLKNMYASNGLSAGNTEKEALVQGLSECIERGVKNYIIREGLSLPTIDDETLLAMGYLDIVREIEDHGYPVIVKDASLGGRFPVICALLINKVEGTVLSSFGCHPNTKVAMDRTLTELLQGRKLESLEGFSEIVYDLDQASDESNIESHFINSSGVFYADILKEAEIDHELWDFDGDRECELNYLKNILESEGYKYYYRAYDLGGMWVTQSIVPGLSEIYPIEDLEWDNRNRAGSLRDFLKSESPDDKIVAEAIRWFEQGYLHGNEQVMGYLGISVDENEPMYDLILDELELLILLVNGDLNNVKIKLGELLLNQMNPERAGFWRAVISYFKVDGINIRKIYGEDNYNCLQELLSGQIPRGIFPALGNDFSKVRRHTQVREVYLKYRKLRS